MVCSGESMLSKSDTPLQIIAKSSALIFIGTLVSLVLSFISRVLLVKLTTQSEYGTYALSLTIVTICITISTLGLHEGVTRHIASFKTHENNEIIQNTIFSSLFIVLITSTLFTIILYNISDYLSIRVFSLPEMSPVLKMLAVTIPFMVFMSIIISVYRAFNNINVRIIINDIIKPASYLAFLGIVVFLNMSFKEMIYAYIVSTCLSFMIIAIYFLKKPPVSVKWKQMYVNNNTKELLTYSVPLLAVSILLTIMSWTDTLMIGYFKDSKMVASYNAAYPVAGLLSIVINSIGFLYVPIVSKLHSHNQVDELRKINASSTKWCFILTFPLFIIVFLFPDTILSVLYDARYIDASKVLQILAIGTVMNSYFGLNYYTLLSTGKSSLLMFCSLISALLNIILNLILIPPYGMVGAAIASSSSFILIEAYMSFKLYKDFKIHVFTYSYLKITFLCICFTFSSILINRLFISTFTTILIFSSSFVIIYAYSIYYINGIDFKEHFILKGLKKIE